MDTLNNEPRPQYLIDVIKKEPGQQDLADVINNVPEQQDLWSVIKKEPGQEDLDDVINNESEQQDLVGARKKELGQQGLFDVMNNETKQRECVVVLKRQPVKQESIDRINNEPDQRELVVVLKRQPSQLESTDVISNEPEPQECVVVLKRESVQKDSVWGSTSGLNGMDTFNEVNHGDGATEDMAVHSEQTHQVALINVSSLVPDESSMENKMPAQMAGFDEGPMNLKRPSQNNDEERRIPKRSRRAKNTETKIECKTQTKQEKNKDLFLNFINLTSLLNATETDEALIEFCKSYGLLPSSVVCRNCGKILEKYYAQKRKDKYIYRFQCPRKACRYAGRNRIYMRKNTFFEGAKISMRKSLVLTYQFISKATIEQSVLETSGHVYNYELTSPETVVDFFSYCREVCVESLCNWYNSKTIGGKHFSVELDVIQFGRRRNKACGIEDGQWMMGGYCRETNASFLVPLENREENTFLRTIEQRVEKKTTIITDCISCHKELREMGYRFKDVRLMGCENSTGSNLQMDSFTKRIAVTWFTLKRALLKSSTKQNQFVQYFAEYIWRKKHSNKLTLFTDFLHEIARVFPGPD